MYAHMRKNARIVHRMLRTMTDELEGEEAVVSSCCARRDCDLGDELPCARDAKACVIGRSRRLYSRAAGC